MANKKTYRISEDRILQISNDISEDMCHANNFELIEVVKYFRNEFDRLYRKKQIEKYKIATQLIELGSKVLSEPNLPKKGKN